MQRLGSSGCRLDPHIPRQTQLNAWRTKNVRTVSFDSQWIQKIDDAKNLYDWITKQWKNKQSVVKIKTFANPLISIGDVISVNYPFNGFDGTQKFVITNVTQSWGEGLSTDLTARSIYSA